VVRVHALRVINQHFNHAALADVAVAASFDHAFQLSLESIQTAQSHFHLAHLLASESIGGGAGLLGIILQFEKCANGIEIKAEFAAMPDEG
jgi:hypothetical protein